LDLAFGSGIWIWHLDLAFGSGIWIWHLDLAFGSGIWLRNCNPWSKVEIEKWKYEENTKRKILPISHPVIHHCNPGSKIEIENWIYIIGKY
jgi:hypothetical protein